MLKIVGEILGNGDFFMPYLGTELAGSHCPRRYYAARAPPLPILWHHFFKACYKRTERERRAGTEKPSSSASSHRSVARSSARPPARPPGRRPLTSALSTPPLSLLLFAAAVVWVVTVVACGSSNNSGGSGGQQP